jgi:hypothetical protein
MLQAISFFLSTKRAFGKVSLLQRGANGARAISRVSKVIGFFLLIFLYEVLTTGLAFVRILALKATVSKIPLSAVAAVTMVLLKDSQVQQSAVFV